MLFSDRFVTDGAPLCDFDRHVPAPYIRKSFTLDEAPSRAEITVTGLGLYEIYVNGKEITKDLLSPYISNPDDVCYYDCYDLTPLLKKGENAIGFILGNGMRNAFGGFIWDFDKAPFRGPLLLAVALEAEVAGKTLLIEADETFKCHPSPILFNDMRMGYHYDSSLEIPGWCDVGFDDALWTPAISAEGPKGEKKLCDADPVRVIERLKPVKIEHFDTLPYAYKGPLETAEPYLETIRENVYVYDFGINTAGITELHVTGKPGQKITIRHGEILQGGKFSVNTVIFDRDYSQKQYFEYGQTDVFVLKGGEEVLRPKFKYDGFRYAYVEGLTPEQATPDALTYLVAYSDVKTRAGFSCSNADVNALCALAHNADLSNLHDFPTDCPHREQNGWTGDASTSMLHYLLTLDAKKTMRTWLDNIVKAQRDDGALPGIVPTGGWGFAWGNGPAWDSICVTLPYYLFRFDGDKDAIRTALPAILKYFEYAKSKRDEDGLVCYGLGDWHDPFRYTRQPNGFAAPERFTDSAMLTQMAERTAILARAVGDEHAEKIAKELHTQMRDAMRAHLLDREKMTFLGDCQTSVAVGLEYGLYNEDEIPAARRRLLEIYERDGYINMAGMIGLRNAYHAMAKFDQCDLAVRMITSHDRTCFGAWLDRGATAALEGFPYPDGRELCSHNHHYLGDYLSFFIEDIAGITPNPNLDDVNFVALRPHFPKAIDEASGYYDTACGRVSTEWVRKGGRITLTVKIPEGVRATLTLPVSVSCDNAGEALTSGTHTFILKSSGGLLW